MKIAFLSAALAAMSAVSGKDMRPPFDKSDYKGTMAVQVNLWFPLGAPAADVSLAGNCISLVRGTLRAGAPGFIISV